MKTQTSGLNQGALLMLIASLAFIGYAVVFLLRNFTGGGFELGVDTLNGVTRENLNALNPAIMHYIGHLHVATAGFIAATGIAVGALSWYGVRRGEWWAWIAAVAAPVVGLAVALPYHYTGTFQQDWVTHLGPIYLATLVFVVGALLALRAMTRRA
jgi:cytochrome bd-type quinol oxidase subunit 1